MPCRGSRWRGLALRHRPLPAEAGFLLPLALTVALLLLLGSLMLVSLALQGRVQASVQRQRRQAEDRLMSAAQQLAGRLQRHCPELLAQPHTAWSASPCSGFVGAESAQLVSYQPGEGSGELLLELQGVEPPLRAARAAFTLHWQLELQPDGEAGLPRLTGLGERGLRATGAPAGQEAGS
jgi:hypothetical protein